MKRIFWLALLAMLIACQPPATISVNILDGDRVTSLQTDTSTPAAIVAKAGITLSGADKIEFNGADLPGDFSLPAGGPYTLQIRRAHTLTLITPDGQTSIQTSAADVAQALAQAGLRLSAADFVAPPLETPLNNDLTVTYRPSRDLSASIAGKTIPFKASALTVGQALASAGLALQGLDKSIPPESDPLPADGRIKVIRVTETVTTIEKPIPFSKKFEYSTDLAVGSQKIIQAGEPGLSVSRVRIRYEDGAEVARITEAETVVRQPQDSVISLGTLAQINTLDIPGGQIQYWRAVPMYATSYSPCRSGTPQCSYGTASGLPVKRGVVALIRSLYNQLSGYRVYIPGYGVAVIGDVGGGLPDGRLWIDLAYSDDDYQGWSGMVTVYFLAPAPPAIPGELQ